MSAVFTVIVYLTAGLAIVIWLNGQDRLPGGSAVKIAAVLFWPAYLPLCLAAQKTNTPEDPTLAQLAQQIAKLPVGEAKRHEYQGAAERLGAALASRRFEHAKLDDAEKRLEALAASFEAQQRPLVDGELTRVRAAKKLIDRDVARAREGILRLVLRLEVIDLEGSKRDLDRELSSLEEEIGRLLEAKNEAELAAQLPGA